MNIDEKIKEQNRIIQKAKKELERLFVLREEQRNKDQMNIWEVIK